MNDPERTGAYRPDASEALPVDAAKAKHLDKIGRCRVEKILGEGGFGLVYLAHDEQLHRPVAIKASASHSLKKPSQPRPHRRNIGCIRKPLRPY